MRVQRVLPPSVAESWTVIGSDLRPVESVVRYLAWLSRIERAPTTVRAYAHDRKLFFEFVESRRLASDAVTLEQLGEFTASLRQPAENVVLLASRTAARSPTTVNRILTAVFGFYAFHARHGAAVARALVDERRAGRGSFRPFCTGSLGRARADGLGGIAKSAAFPRRCRWSRWPRSWRGRPGCAIGSCSRCCRDGDADRPGLENGPDAGMMLARAVRR